jgi:hypothetical protein
MTREAGATGDSIIVGRRLTCTDALAGKVWDWFATKDFYLEPNESIDTNDTYGRAFRYLLEEVADRAERR